MMANLSPYLWFAASLVALLVAHRWFRQRFFGLLLLITRRPKWAYYVYAGLFFPGVVLHEVSHWLSAKLLKVRTYELSLKPKIFPDGSIRFGYVEMEQPDALRSALIGAAPLIAGTVALALLGSACVGWDSAVQSSLAGEWPLVLEHLQGLKSTPALGLWVYLALVISNTMLPSASDRSAWLPVAGFATALGGALLLLGCGPKAAALLADPLEKAVRLLAAVFTVAAALDLLLFPPLWLLERLLTRVIGLRVAN
jgi:hypothetical protein